MIGRNPRSSFFSVRRKFLSNISRQVIIVVVSCVAYFLDYFVITMEPGKRCGAVWLDADAPQGPFPFVTESKEVMDVIGKSSCAVVDESPML